MPATSTTTTTPTRRDATGDQGALLADALSSNAIFSGLTGIVLAGGGPWLAAPIGVPAIALTGLGIGLVLFAVAILVALTRPARLRTAAMGIVAADLLWIVAAAALVSAEVLAPRGDVLLGGVSTVVAGLAIAQLLGLRRAGDSALVGVRPVEITATREVDASPEHAWELVADAAGYDAYAPGIDATSTDGDLEQGMRRVCVDDGGRSWGETCTLVEPGVRYRMEVDTSTYPARYRNLLHRFGMTWEIAPTAGGTRMTLTFSGLVKLGVLGRLGIAAMTRDDPTGIIVARYADELAAGAWAAVGSDEPLTSRQCGRAAVSSSTTRRGHVRGST